MCCCFKGVSINIRSFLMFLFVFVMVFFDPRSPGIRGNIPGIPGIFIFVSGCGIGECLYSTNPP